MKTIAISCALSVAVAVSIHAQGGPPPIDLGIQNIRQETQFWCWAAVAQQLIAALQGPQNTPPQCALVAQAYGAAPGVCCQGMGNPACVRTGSMQQIQALLYAFGGRPSQLAPPADPMTIYQTLVSRRAIILHVRSGQSSSHVVVVRGMTFLQTPYGVQAMLLINDPMSFYTQPVPFANIVPIWIEALVVS